MKKRKIKNYFRYGILLIGILTTLVNCDKEPLMDSVSFNESIIPESLTNYVSHKDIPNIVNAVTELTGEKAIKNTIIFKTTKNRTAGIDIKKVLKVKNKKGFTNYTFRVTLDDSAPNVFYNMIVGEDPDKKVKKPFIYKYVVDQDALSAFIASGNNMRYFKGMRYLMTYNQFLKERKKANREPDSSETILDQDCPNTENYGIPIVPQTYLTNSDGGGSTDPYYPYGNGYIYPSTYNTYPTYPDPNTTYNPQTSYPTPLDPVTGVYGTYSPTTPITSGSTDPQPNTSNPTNYYNAGGSSPDYNLYIYTYTTEWYGTGMDSSGSTSGSGGSSSCTIIMIDFFYDILLIAIGNCTEYTQRTALINPDCPDPQGTIGVLPPENCSPGMVYDSNIGGCVNAPDKVFLDPSFENSKANCVYKLLGKQDGLKNIISKLIPENSPYDLTWKVTKDLKNLEGNKVNALTDGSYDPNFKDILIIIDEDFAETTTFPYLATIIVHEAIHAKLFEMVKSVGGLNNLNQFTNETTEFGKLWAYYDKYKVTHSWQHELMYGNYLKNIGDAVENFHKTYYLEDYTKFHNNMSSIPYYNKSTFYENIAAYGLRNTTQFPKDQLPNIILLVEDLKINSKANTCID